MSLLNLEGAYENELAATGEFNPQAPKTALMLPSGQRIVLPTELLLQGFDASARTMQNADQRAGLHTDQQTTLPSSVEPPKTAANAGTEAHENVIPLVEEQLVVGKQEVETARVRVRRETQEVIQPVNVALADVRWEVEHVALERKVDSAPEIRQVGETFIFPLVEERMVVSRELWLREEIHVRRVKTVVEKSAEFPVRRDVLVEERSDSH